MGADAPELNKPTLESAKTNAPDRAKLPSLCDLSAIRSTGGAAAASAAKVCHLDLSMDKLYVQPSAEGAITVAKNDGPDADKQTDAAKHTDATTNGARIEHKFDLESERARLERTVIMRIPNVAERQQFKDDVETLSRRAATRTPPLTSDEVACTFKHVSDLLAASNNPRLPLTADDRLALAEQVIHQAARPESIYQGEHNTCNATTVEIGIYSRNPAEAARMVADMATTGHYTTMDGKTHVSLKRSELTPLDKEAENRITAAGDRSYASQIFQLTAVNAFYANHGLTYTDAHGKDKIVPAGKIRYEQLPEKSQASNSSGSRVTYERLIDTSSGKDVVIQSDWKKHTPEDGPDFNCPDIAALGDTITGKGSTLVIEHSDNRDANGPVRAFRNEAELQQLLTEAKQQGKLPAILGVDASQAPFSYDAGHATALDPSGEMGMHLHVVSIMDYDDKSAKVFIHNPASDGESTDHLTSKTGLDTLTVMEASRPYDRKIRRGVYAAGGATSDLNQEVLQNRKNHRVDSAKELDLERQRHDFTTAGEALPPGVSKLQDGAYQADIIDTLNKAAARWKEQKRNGTFDQSEQERTLVEAKVIIDHLPAVQRIKVLATESNTGAIPPKQLSQELDDAVLDFNDEHHNAAVKKRFRANVDMVRKHLKSSSDQ